LGAQQPPPYTSDTARAENANVKALVENLLWREQKGRNLPFAVNSAGADTIIAEDRASRGPMYTN
jgi:hypothetical protein